MFRRLRQRKSNGPAIARGEQNVHLPIGLRDTLLVLEPRIMFDGAAVATGAEVAADQVAQEQAEAAATSETNADTSSPETTEQAALFEALTSYGRASVSERREIVFIDTRVEDYQTLMEGIDPNAEVILLDSTRDGVEQIAEVLNGRTNIDAIHLIAEGNEAELHLGTTFLTQDAISGQYADLFTQIGQSLSAEADLLIYGCNFGQGEAGLEAMESLAELTGVDIAASTDRTGHTTEYANWDLEISTGTIESSIVIGEATQEAWEGVLATYTVTTTTDGGPNSLRQAIIDANANVGTDTITFVGGGTYTLTLTGTGENAAATGDLDITDDLIITGNGVGTTVIDGGGNDRVFEVRSGATVNISDMTIQNGNISANGGGVLIASGSNLTLSDVVVSGNTSGGNGGGINNDGTLTLFDTAISGNSAVWGGGIFNDGSMTLERVTIDANMSSNNGGGIYNDFAASSLINVTISGNTSGNNGGGIFTNQSIDITNSTIASNLGGSGIHTLGPGDAILKNTILDNNVGGNANRALTSLGNNIDSDSTAGLGDPLDGQDPMLGALANNGASTQTHALLVGSPAINAGTTVGAPIVDQRGFTRDAMVDIGAYEFGATLGALIVDTTNDLVDGDTSSVAALLADKGTDGFISLREAIIAVNAGAGGETINLAAGTYTLSIGGTGENAAATGDLDIIRQVTISGAGAGSTIIDAGGIDRALDVISNTTTISGLTIQGGAAGSERGGGVRVGSGSNLTLQDVEVTGNASSNHGGGIFVSGMLTLDRVTIEGNTGNNGGAIAFLGASGGSLTNVTISGNTGTLTGGGLWTDTPITVNNSTFTLNNTINGGGIFANVATVTISNTIVSGNTASSANDDVVGSFSSDGFNLIEVVGAATGFGSDLTGVSANLGVLADNGGPTQTHALLVGSLAIDAGTATGAPTVDQRGFTRDATPDIGAFESASLVTTAEFTVNDPSGNNEETAGLVRGAERAVDIAPNGDYVVVWTDTTAGDKLFAKVLDKDGNEKVAQFQVNVVTGTSNNAGVAMDDSGNFVVTWTKGSDIFMRRFQADGTAVDLADVMVNTVNLNQQENPSISMNGSGNFVIAWQSNTGGNEGIFVRQGSFAGGLIGSDITVDLAATSQDPSVDINDDGKFVVVWQQGNEPHAQRFAADGTPRGSAIDINPLSSSLEQHPVVAVQSSGDFVVAYRSEIGGFEGVWMKRYLDDGTASPMFATLVKSGISHEAPSIGMDSSGNYIIVYEGDGDGSGKGVFGRSYDSGGTAQGAEFQINQTTANAQDRASVAMLDQNDFVVVWTGNDGTQTDVFARQFGSAINSAPTLDLDADDSSGATGNDYQFTFTEGDAPTAIADSDTDLADVDSTTFDHVTVAVSGLLDGNAETLVLDGDTFALAMAVAGQDTSGGNYRVVITTGAGTATVTITKQGGGTFNETETETLITAIQYQHTDTSTPTDGDRLVDVTVNDGTADSTAARTTINVNPTNDAPTLDLDADDSSGATGNDYQFTFTEGDGATAIADSDTDVADVDSTTFDHVTVAVSGLLDGNFETLVLDGDTFALATAVAGQDTSGGNYRVVITTGAGTATVTITKQGGGTFNETETETLIEAIQYQHTWLGAPTDGDRLLDVTVNDGTVDSATARTTINVNPVNDATVLDLDADNSSGQGGADFATSFTEGLGAVTIADTDAFLNDVDSVNLTSLTVTITNLLDGANESLAANTGGTSIIANYNSGTGVLTLSGADTVANYQQVMRTVTYDNSSASPTTTARVITFVANDGMDPSNVGSATVTINTTNTAPTATPDSYTIDEDTTLTTESDWFDQAWQSRQKLTFNNTAQAQNLADFPVLITLDAGRIDYTKVQDAGEDLRFVDVDGSELAYEIESWDELGTSYVWVKVPQIDASSGTDYIWMYYDNPAALDNQNPNAVWSNNYELVSHLHDDFNDSSATPNNGVNTGPLAPNTSGSADVTGQIGDGQNFDGVDDRISISSEATIDDIFNGGGTVSAWINISDWGENGLGRILNKANGTVPSPGGWSMEVRDTNDSLSFEYGFNGNFGRWRAENSLTLGPWQYVTVVFDNSSATNDPTMYVNGTAMTVVEHQTPTGTAVSDAGIDLAIGNRSGSTDRTFDGIIDEARIATTQRSADWIAAQYLSTTDAFVTYAAAEGPGGVLANDSDVDGDPLTAIQVSPDPANAQSFTFNPDGSFSYTPIANFDGVDTFTYKVNDGTVDGNTVVVTLNVNPLNDAPVLDLDADDSSGSGGADFATTFTEGLGAVTVADADASVSDVDSANLTSLTVTITNLLDGANESLAANTGGTSIIASYNSGTGVLTLSGADSVANYQQVLRTVTYDNSSQNPTTTARVMTFVANDGTDPSNVGNTTVTMNAVNNAPVLDLDADDSSGSGAADFATTFTEGLGAVTIADADASVSDVDSANLTSLTVTITNLLDGANEVLAANTGGTSITASYNSGTGVLTLSGADTVANYQQVLRTVTYDNSSLNPTTTARVMTFVANDGTDPSNVGNTTVTMNASNTAPTLDLDADDSSGATGNDYQVTFTEGDAPTAIADSDTDLADVDSTTFDHVTVAVSGLLDGNAETLVLDGDTFALATAVAGQDTSGGNYRVVITTGAGTATVTITKQGGGTFTEAETETLIEAIQYQHTDTSAPTDGDRLLDVTVNDGTADSAAARTTINVNPINAPPVAVADGFVVNEGSTNNLNLAGNDTDADDGLDLTSINIISGPTNGTIVNINTDGTVDYTHDGSETLVDSFTYTIDDLTGATSNTVTVSLTVTPMNDPPVITSDGGGVSASVNAAENQTSVTTVTASDQDVPANTLTYSISGGADSALFFINSSTGVLTFNTAPDFAAPTDANTDGVYEVTVQVDDGNGGSDTQVISVTVTGSPIFVPPPTSDTDSDSDSESDSDADAETSSEGDSSPAGEGSLGDMTSVGDSPQGLSSGGGHGSTLKTMSAQPGRGEETAQMLSARHELTDGEGAIESLSELIDGLRQSFEPTAWMSEIQLLLTRPEFLHDLDRVRDAFNEVGTTEKINVASSIAASTGLSIGYVIWLVRSGVLLSTLLSTLPAWQFVNPVQVLATPVKRKRKKGAEDREDDSLESMVEEADTSETQTGPEPKVRKSRWSRRT